MPTTRISLLPTFFILLLLAVVSLQATSQINSGNNDPIYGYDPLLYNGRVYNFLPLRGTEGTQYLFDTFDTNASMTVRGVTFTNISLNLDIYNQQLILEYKSVIGAPGKLEVSKAWLENFEIHGVYFEPISTNNTTIEYFQVLGTGPSKILYSCSKKLLQKTLSIIESYFFSTTQKTMYLFDGNQKIKFNNNKSFVDNFTKVNQDMIKKYIRNHQIDVKKAKDIEMKELINYCNSLSGT